MTPQEVADRLWTEFLADQAFDHTAGRTWSRGEWWKMPSGLSVTHAGPLSPGLVAIDVRPCYKSSGDGQYRAVATGGLKFWALADRGPYGSKINGRSTGSTEARVQGWYDEARFKRTVIKLCAWAEAEAHRLDHVGSLAERCDRNGDAVRVAVPDEWIKNVRTDRRKGRPGNQITVSDYDTIFTPLGLTIFFQNLTPDGVAAWMAYLDTQGVPA